MPTFVPTCAHPMLGVESIGNRFLQAGHEIAIGIHGNFDGCVAKSLLNDLGLCAQLYEHGCMRMPLRYNYDKPEKPRRIKGFEVFSLVFSSFSKPKNHTEISRIIGGVSLTTNE